MNGEGSFDSNGNVYKGGWKKNNMHRMWFYERPGCEEVEGGIEMGLRAEKKVLGLRMDRLLRDNEE